MGNIDPDVAEELAKLNQGLVTRMDLGDEALKDHLVKVNRVLSESLTKLAGAHDELVARVAALEAASEPPVPPAYFTDDDIARIRATGAASVAVTTLLGTKIGRDVLTTAPAPVVEVRAPSSGTLAYVSATPSVGAPAGDPVGQAHAAYVAALLWLATYDERYAVKAEELVTAWQLCERILFDQPRRTDSNGQVWVNGKLVAAWSAPLFQRAADILTRTGRPCTFQSKAWVDVLTAPVYGHTGNQNWILSIAAALLEVHPPGTPEHAAAREYLVAMVPACIALGNSATNLPPAQSKQFTDPAARIRAWGSPRTWVDGLCQESSSDMGHSLMGISAAVNAATLCRNIGEPLPADIEARIVAAVELHAGWLLEALPVLVNGNTPTGWTPTGWPFSTPFKMGGTAGFNGWAVAVATFGDRVPKARQLAASVAPEGFGHHSSYGTLTHT